MRPTPFPTHFYSPPFHSLHHHTVQSIPSPFTRLKTNTPYPFQPFTHKHSPSQQPRKLSAKPQNPISVHADTPFMTKHARRSNHHATNHYDARRTPEGLQKDSRRTPEGLQKDETTTQKPSVECACAMHCGAVQCTALHCIAL